MGQAINLLAIAVGIVAIWTGAKKIKLNKFWKAVLVIADLALLGMGLFAAGKAGIAVAVGANILGAMGFGLAQYMEKQDLLTRAAIASSSDVKTLFTLQSELRKTHRPIRHIQPLDQSRLILYLSQQARSPSDIRIMAPYIAALWVVHREDIELRVLVEKFDRLLRLWSMSPREAGNLADKLSILVQKSPATLEECMDGLIGFKTAL